MCHNLGRKPAMNDGVTESPAAESRKWIGRFLIAVVLGEAIWAFLVAITNHVAVPAMARVIGVADEQSPLYLGRGDYNIPALFAAVLQLCLAGIVAVLLNSWSQRTVRVRTRIVSRSTVPRTDAVPSIIAPPVASPAAPASMTLTAAPLRVAETQAVPANPQPVPVGPQPIEAQPAALSSQPVAAT